MEAEITDLSIVNNGLTPKGSGPKSGFRLIMPFVQSHKNMRGRFHSAGSRLLGEQVYRYGMSNEVRSWLLDVIGPQCQSQQEWDNMDLSLRWIYMGSRIPSGCLINQGSAGTTALLVMAFRDKSQAMMFKLAWAGKL